jgi:hypothetical protein
MTMGRVSAVRILATVKPVYKGIRRDASIFFRFKIVLMFVCMRCCYGNFIFSITEGFFLGSFYCIILKLSLLGNHK